MGYKVTIAIFELWVVEDLYDTVNTMNTILHSALTCYYDMSRLFY